MTMLPFPQFGYAAPATVAEAVALLARPGARVLAGGTDLLPSMKHRLFPETEVLVSTRRLADLRGITELPDGTLAIGAACTLHSLARHPEILTRYPGLAAACRTVATPTIQRTATLGGNVLLDTRCLYYNQPAGWREAVGGCLKCEGSVCHVAPKGKGCYAAHSADTVPTLMLLGAQAEIVGAAGARIAPVATLSGADGRDSPLRPGELLTRLLLPPPVAPTVHRKLRTRAAIDYGLLLVAAQRREDGLHVIVSGTGPRPVYVHGTDAAEVAEEAWRLVQPLGTHGPPVPWRKRMVRVEVRRALEGVEGRVV